MNKHGKFVIWENPGESVEGTIDGSIKQNKNGKPYLVLKDGNESHFVYINEFIISCIDEQNLYGEVVKITSVNGAGYLKIEHVDGPDKPHDDWLRREELMDDVQYTLDGQPCVKAQDTEKTSSSGDISSLKEELVQIYNDIGHNRYGTVPVETVQCLMETILSVEENILERGYLNSRRE